MCDENHLLIDCEVEVKSNFQFTFAFFMQKFDFNLINFFPSIAYKIRIEIVRRKKNEGVRVNRLESNFFYKKKRTWLNMHSFPMKFKANVEKKEWTGNANTMLDFHYRIVAFPIMNCISMCVDYLKHEQWQKKNI